MDQTQIFEKLKTIYNAELAKNVNDVCASLPDQCPDLVKEKIKEQGLSSLAILKAVSELLAERQNA